MTEPWQPITTAVVDLRKFTGNTGNPSIDTDAIWYIEPDDDCEEGIIVAVHGGVKSYLRLTFGREEGNPHPMQVSATWHWRVPEPAVRLRLTEETE